jgi:hypothetical protein
VNQAWTSFWRKASSAELTSRSLSGLDYANVIIIKLTPVTSPHSVDIHFFDIDASLSLQNGMDAIPEGGG